MEFTGTIGVNTGDIVKTIADQNTEVFIEYIFRPTAGALTCELKVNGIWSQVAMEDMLSTAPSTYVLTASNVARLYRVTGRVNGIRFKQSGATPSNVQGRASD